MEIRAGGRPLTVTMRTPGDDFDPAAGFLTGEGVVHAAADVTGIRYCAGATADGGNTYNVVDIALAPGVALSAASLDAVRMVRRWSVAEDPPSVGPELLAVLPERLRAAQRVFDSTGGLYAAGLFTADGELLCLREDVGRRQRRGQGRRTRPALRPAAAAETVLMVSGRASFEPVHKAVLAGIPLLAAVSAPSSPAVDLAAESGLTLVGFLRGTSMNVYTGAERLAPQPVG
ncbi:formate dehydrogenase accessory sulfurtransferase FdhD [Streptomyces lasalocidi]